MLERPNLLESGDDGNFVISALKVLNLFDIRSKAKQRTTKSSDDMTEAELLRLGWQRNALQARHPPQQTREDGKCIVRVAWREHGNGIRLLAILLLHPSCTYGVHAQLRVRLDERDA